MESIVILGLLLLLLAAVGPLVFAMRERWLLPAEQLELCKVLERRGLAERAAQNPIGFGVALRRCTFCRSVERCNDWLESPAGSELQDFCPNAAFVERVAKAGTR